MNQRCHLGLVLLAFVSMTFATRARAQVPMSEAEALHYVGRLTDGIDGIDAERRARVRSSPEAISLYAKLLSGERHVSGYVDTAAALWWLAESDDPAFIPLFLRYAGDDMSEFHRAMAVYGLARHSSRDDVRLRLTVLGQSDSRRTRGQVTRALVHVNDEHARRILRDVSLDGMGPRMTQLVRRVLAAPARRDKGRFPCPPRQILAPGRDGAFECSFGVAERRP
jgi:hypothetical protein